MRKLTTIATVVGLALTGAVLAAEPAPLAPLPPPRAPGAAAEVRPLKVEGGDAKLTITGELLSRFELQNNMQDFNSDTRDTEDWVDARARLGFKFELQDTEVFIQPQARYVWGGQSGYNDPGTGAPADLVDRDSFDLYQARVTLLPETLGTEVTSLTVGRTELALGSEMLVGDNSRYGGLSFDAVRVDTRLMDNLDTAIFGAKVVENDAFAATGLVLNGLTAGATDNRADVYLFGLWNTYTVEEDTKLDLYALLVKSEMDATTSDATFTPGFFDGDLYTLGARLKFDSIPMDAHTLDLSVEVATQVGEQDVAGQNFDVKDTYGLEAELGFRPDLVWKPRIAGGFAWASGDSDPNDTEINTFNSLFEDTEGRLGDSDIFLLSNIRCWYLKAELEPEDVIVDLKVGAAYFRFEAMEESDVAGGALANGAGTTANNIGDELDVYADYVINKHASLKLTWAHLDPQAFVNDQAGLDNSPANRFFVSLGVKW